MIARLMAGVIIVAPFFLGLRDDPESERLGGGFLVGSCLLILSGKLTIDALATDGRSAGSDRS